MNTDNSIVVAAPTGAGKTVIFELAVLRMLLHGPKDSKVYGFVETVQLKQYSRRLSSRFVSFFRQCIWRPRKHCVQRGPMIGKSASVA